MAQTIFQKSSLSDNPIGFNKLTGILSIVFIGMVSLTIFQDYLESNRSGYSFYFSESILFKSIWFVFIPTLPILYNTLKNQKFNKIYQTTLLIPIALSIHIAINSLAVWLLSFLFYNGRYDLYKVFTYTLANDFYQLVAVYAFFILGFKYLSTKFGDIISPETKTWLSNMTVTSGKNNIVINVNDVFHITAATPYISVQLENRKYLHTETLKSISGNLNPNNFVRVHKSTIVNVDKVVSYKSRLNGDYDILLKNRDEIRLSRTYASNFKKIFNPTPQVSL